MLKTRRGFTLIELLVVIAIVGVLASVVLASLNSARMKSRDTIRIADMRTIFTMLTQYQIEYGGIPKTSVYGGDDGRGWDYSSQPTGAPTFLNFLITSGIAAKVPLDPINNSTNIGGDYLPAGTYSYRYYCYPGEGLALQYKKESTGVITDYGRFKDPDFTCL